MTSWLGRRPDVLHWGSMVKPLWVNLWVMDWRRTKILGNMGYFRLLADTPSANWLFAVIR